MEKEALRPAAGSDRRILYTPSAFAKEALIYLQETGTLTARQPHTTARSGLPSYLFFIVRAGEGVVTAAGKPYPVQAGDCFFTDCMQPYSQRSGEHLWQLQWVHFNGVTAPKLYRRFVEQTGRPVFRAAAPERITGILDDLYRVAGQEDGVQDLLIFRELTALLAEIMQQSRPATVSSPGDKVSAAAIRAYIDRRFAERLTLDGLAAQFFVNKYYLERLFKKEYGLSPLAYQQQRRLNEAKRLLRFTDLTADRIGRQVGIGEPYYFSRLFKKIEGVGPREYRRSWRTASPAGRQKKEEAQDEDT
ncbi:MAG: helix-turn-helix domain-containing protein [Clostridia bacterium]|nr:helix-turn-helix domain-containing protein [Clostridia bacterium]